MRHPWKLLLEQGWHAFSFQLVVGGKIMFLFINPILWITTIVYFSFRSLLGSSIEALFPPMIFYMATISLVVGNFLYLYYYMIGSAKRKDWSMIKYAFLAPFYWILISVAAIIALKQLIQNPHYWEKTVHGLHLRSFSKFSLRALLQRYI
jgi:hypothetical protein